MSIFWRNSLQIGDKLQKEGRTGARDDLHEYHTGTWETRGSLQGRFSLEGAQFEIHPSTLAIMDS